MSGGDSRHSKISEGTEGGDGATGLGAGWPMAAVPVLGSSVSVTDSVTGSVIGVDAWIGAVSEVLVAAGLLHAVTAASTKVRAVVAPSLQSGTVIAWAGTDTFVRRSLTVERSLASGIIGPLHLESMQPCS